jgi:hypothetical protein
MCRQPGALRQASAYALGGRPDPVAGPEAAGRQVATAAAAIMQEVPMPSDLAALTPPLLVALAFLVAVGAFLRHEMRRGKNRTEDEQGTDTALDSSADANANEPEPGSSQRSFGKPAADREHDAGDPPDRDR